MKKNKKNNIINIDELINNEDIYNVDISNEIKTSTINYAMSVITDRALPDIRDGLKPAQRRILYATYNKKILPNSNFVKCAEISGEVMGKYHAHGSSYGTLCNMSQTWNFRYPLMDFHGNNGSMDGDEPAAERYTESKLHKNAMELLNGIEEDSVDFVPNYSETLMEPTVLPGLLPNLLINGSYGIAVGYTTKFPSHNLNEIIDGIIQVIKKPDSTLKDIMKYIKGPDFPLGACLINNENIEKLYTDGQASLTFKAKYFIENNNENNNIQIVINELPPDVNKNKLVEKLYNLCIEKKSIPRVVDIRDESNGENGIRIVIELHKTAILDVVLNELFNKTELKQSVSYIMRCIDNKTPKLLSLKELIEKYIEFHKEVYVRKFNTLLNKTQKKLHIQEGFNKILTNINKTIDIIKNADDDKMAKEELIKEFKLSEEQADVILDMQLRRITKLGNKNINEIIGELNDKINYYNEILSNDDKLNNLFINELNDLKKKLGDERRTEIINEEHLNIEQNIDKELVIALTNKNNIKQYEFETFDELIKKGYKEKSEIFLQHLKININDNLLLILNNGNYICIGFNDLLGDINTLIEKQTINKIIPLNEENLSKVLVIMTSKGLVKKCYINKFKTKKKIFNLIELDNDDKIIKTELIDENDNNIITVASSNGLIHRFYLKSFKETTPGGKGLSSMSLQDNTISDYYISNLNNDENNYLILYAKNEEQFLIKKLKLNEFFVKGRIAKGTKAINFTEKNPGKIYKIIISNDNFNIINNKGIIKNIKLSEIKENNKNTKGEKINYDILIEI